MLEGGDRGSSYPYKTRSRFKREVWEAARRHDSGGSGQGILTTPDLSLVEKGLFRNSDPVISLADDVMIEKRNEDILFLLVSFLGKTSVCFFFLNRDERSLCF